MPATLKRAARGNHAQRATACPPASATSTLSPTVDAELRREILAEQDARPSRLRAGVSASRLPAVIARCDVGDLRLERRVDALDRA